MLDTVDDLKVFLKNHLDTFEGSGKSNPLAVDARFELSPRDYLSYASEELDKNTPLSLINCVSHLKRALDCQLDSFFHIFNLYDLFKKKNLKVQKKLEFIGAIGFLNSRALVRLNTIRNKMEHQYTVPDIQDIDVYFDLITALVQLLEYATFDSAGSDFDFEIEGCKYSRFYIEYKRQDPHIHILCKSYSSDEEDLTLIVPAEGNIEDFAFCFKVMRMLNIFWDRQGGSDYVLRELNIT